MNFLNLYISIKEQVINILSNVLYRVCFLERITQLAQNPVGKGQCRLLRNTF